MLLLLIGPGGCGKSFLQQTLCDRLARRTRIFHSVDGKLFHDLESPVARSEVKRSELLSVPTVAVNFGKTVTFAATGLHGKKAEPFLADPVKNMSALADHLLAAFPELAQGAS